MNEKKEGYTGSDHTFVVLAYGDSPYLSDCLNSLMTQTAHSNIIISTSTPSEFLNQIAESNKVQIFVHENKNSIASDWNYAYSITETRFVTLAHQDDVYDENYTKTFLEYADKYPFFSIMFSDYREIRCFENIKICPLSLNLIIKKILLFPFSLKRKLDRPFWKKVLLSFGDPICCPSVMYNKSYIGSLSFSSEFDCNMDWDAWLYLANENGSFVYINSILLYHRIHNSSQTIKSITSNLRNLEDQKIFMRIWNNWVGKLLAFIYRYSARSNKV